MSSAQPAAPPLVVPSQPSVHTARGSWVRQQPAWSRHLRIARNPMGAFGLGTLLLLVFLAAFAP